MRMHMAYIPHVAGLIPSIIFILIIIIIAIEGLQGLRGLPVKALN